MEIISRLSKIMAEVGPIVKNRMNTQQGYQYRGIDDLYNSLNKLLAKHEVVTIPKVIVDETQVYQSDKGRNIFHRRIQVEYTVMASDGSSIVSVIPADAMDYSDKAIYKALSGAHKYLLFQLFCVPTEEAEPESDHIEVGNASPPPSDKPAPVETAKKVLGGGEDGLPAIFKLMEEAPSKAALDLVYAKSLKQYPGEDPRKHKIYLEYERIRKKFVAPTQKKADVKEVQNDIF